MRAFITNFTTLRTDYTDPGEQIQARRLLQINLSWVIALGIAGPIFVLTTGGYQNLTDLSTLASLGLALLVHYLIQSERFPQARRIFVINVIMVSLMTIFPDYRIDGNPFIIALTLPITAAGVLLRRVELGGVALLVIILTTVGGLFQINADMAPYGAYSMATNIRVTLFIMSVVITLNALMIWAFLSSTDTTLRQQRRLAEEFDAVTIISQSLINLSPSNEALNQLVEQLRSLLHLYHVQIFIVNPSSGQVSLRASTGYLGRRLLEEDSLSTPSDDSPIHDALHQSDPIILRLQAGDQPGSFLPATQSEVLIPLRIKEFLPFGVLDLHSTDGAAFTPTLLKALQILGYHLSIALHNNQQATDLHTSLNERDQLLNQIEAYRRELTKVNRQFVGTTWETYISERESPVPSFDWNKGAIALSQSDSDVLAQTLTGGQSLLVRREGKVDILAVPIRLRDQVLGAIEFRRAEQDAPWSKAALELAEAVADRLALSLENARLFEQTQITAQREQLVNQITSELQTTTELEALIAEAAAQFQQALGATHTRVRLGLIDGEADDSPQPGPVTNHDQA